MADFPGAAKLKRVVSLFRRLWLALMLVPVMLTGATNAPPVSIRWHAATDRYDASIQGLPIGRVLARLSAQTGWKIFIEPGVKSDVRTRFTGLPARDALPRILGGLNFSLTTGTNGVTVMRVFKSAASSAGKEVEADGGEGIIGDELIVRVKKGGKLDAATLAKLSGGQVVGTNDATGAFRLKFDSDEAAASAKKALAGESDVSGVENNMALSPPELPMAVADMAVPPLRLNPTVNPDGTRRVIALIDTAVQPLAPEYAAFQLGAVKMVDGAQPGTEPTHGTAMMESMIRGLSAGSPEQSTSTVIRSYDVYGPNETASTWDVARGVTQAVQDGSTIINLSLGSTQDSPYLRDVIQSVTDQGVVVFAAAGNDASAELFYPAAYEQSVAVTATTRGNQLAPYANYGGFVDLAAPGMTVVNLNGRSWVTQGTSVSSAFAAGVAGALANNPTASLGPVVQALSTALPFRRASSP